MFKKTILLAVSIAALVAFAVPAVAQAEALVTDSLGQPATGTTALSTNTTLKTTGGDFECTTTHFEAHFTTNNTTTAHAEEGPGTAKGNPKVKTHLGPCFSSIGIPTDFTQVTVTRLHLVLGGTSSIALFFTFDVTHPVFGPVHCTLDGSADVDWVTNSDTLTLLNGVLTGTSAAPCPASGTISGEFTMTDALGKPVEIH